jgi:GNAT superfamily N-acetyltransferase
LEWLHNLGVRIFEAGSNFRDYVIQHPKIADNYAKLKIQLATQFPDNIYSYVSGKDKLVQEIDNKAKLWRERKRDYLLPNTGPLAKDWSHDKLIKAMEANLNIHMTHFAQYLNHVELIRIPGFTLVNSGLADDTFNYVIDADFSSADAHKKILEVTDYFAQKKIPFSWWISPHDQPADLSIHLENHSYKNTENNCAMYFDLDAWDEHISLIPELKIIRATDEKTLHDFAFVLANDEAAFKTYFSWIASILTDDDPIEYYVGYVNEKPVVCGLSCYFAQVAGLHWLSTAPTERRKGYGKVMQKYRLKRAKELGYHVVVLQASDKGFPLYQHLGYKKCGHFRVYKNYNSHAR